MSIQARFHSSAKARLAVLVGENTPVSQIMAFASLLGASGMDVTKYPLASLSARYTEPHRPTTSHRNHSQFLAQFRTGVHYMKPRNRDGSAPLV